MSDKNIPALDRVNIIRDPLQFEESPLAAYRPGSKAGKPVRTVLFMAVLAIAAGLILNAVPASFTWDLARLLGVAIVLLVAVVISFRFPQAQLKMALVIWFLVMLSDRIFFRDSPYANASAYAGNFSWTAYSESLAWVLCLMAAVACWAPVRRYLGRILTFDYRWLTLFVCLCVASCAYTPRPLFALAWALKLSLVVTVLALCSAQIRDFRGTVSFLRVTYWAYCLIVLFPVVLAIATGQLFDDEGRMSTVVSPDALSPDAAAIFLLSLVLYSREKGQGIGKATALLFGGFGFVVMILAGGKAGILTGLLTAGLFLFMRKGFGSTVGFGIAAVVVFAVLASVTPLGQYLTHYREANDASSLSGRTLLWSAVLPQIKARPIIGHGYVASAFVGFQINAVGWDAPQLHNGFVEVLYNDGIIGFILMVGVLFIIGRNLWRVVRRSSPSDPIYRIGAGCLALYLLLLLNGFFNASFGGQARAPFVLLLALFTASHALLQQVSRPASSPVSNQMQQQRRLEVIPV